MRTPRTVRFGLLVPVLLGIAWIRPTEVVAMVDCEDFAYHPDAQTALDALPADPYRFDEGKEQFGGRNGVACDTNSPEPAIEAATEIGDRPPVLGDLPADSLPSDTKEVEVEGVFDARWIVVDGEEDIALIGVTMPDQPRRGECHAKEALGRLNELLPDGTTIHLEKDELDYREDDTFERRLRYVWIEQSGGGYDLLNLILVREGFAIVAIAPPNERYAGDLRDAQQQAIEAGAGLWGACA